ncbi:MAG: hypothetical protein H0U23_08420 [Blastocatellia bacterium]|nr:hypothetical protein [Blastocatellia bacterium]
MKKTEVSEESIWREKAIANGWKFCITGVDHSKQLYAAVSKPKRKG